MDRPGSQYTVVSYLITFWPLLFMWSYTGFSGLTVHPLALVAALALPAKASGIANAAKPVRASRALRENDMGISNPSADRRLSPASNRIYAPTPPNGSRRLAGRLHLAAYALGASASGMTFDDSQVPALLGERLDGLLFTCVGVPRYPNAPVGPPGTPTRVRRVTPAP